MGFIAVLKVINRIDLWAQAGCQHVTCRPQATWEMRSPTTAQHGKGTGLQWLAPEETRI